jgi:DNA invertase Pin-like site-specific DNA recombinase
MKELHLAEVFEDPGISGGKPLASRLVGSKHLAAAINPKELVIVSKLDRGSGSVAVAVYVIADFDKKGIHLVSIAKGFDMSSEHGRAMAQLSSVFPELERGVKRKRTRTATNVKRVHGEVISEDAPFGWDFGSSGRLVPLRVLIFG